MPQIVQKSPMLCNCTASNEPEWSPPKGEPALQREMQMLLPSIAVGPARRGAGVPEAACPASSCVCWLAASPAIAPVLAARRETNTPTCSSPWLGTAPVEQMAEPNVPLAIPYCWLGVRAGGDGPGMSWCACDCGDGVFCLGGLSLPSSKGAWNVQLSMGLLVAWLLHWGTALVGQRLLVTLATSRGCWLPVLEEPLLAGTFPG